MDVTDKRLRELESKVLAYRIRIKDADERKTYDEVFDHSTLMIIYDLMSAGIFDTLDFPIATGKEGIVFRATTPDGGFVAVKIYRISNATFNNMLKYIAGDERFKNVGKSRRRAIFLWAQKEFRNLERMHAQGIPVPKPIKCVKNVIAMEFIGIDDNPAPHLKDLVPDEPEKLYEFLFGQIKKMYQKVGLVHADFSEYNILMSNGEPTIIDVGQAVLKNHPMALEFLERDLKNLVRFFKKYDIKADLDTLKVEVLGSEDDEKAQNNPKGLSGGDD
jgi:RIO kinase 1